jgi:hypothetical protein
LDWHAWEREFRSYVATYDLSDKFFREEPFLARPVQPKIPDYPTQLQTRSQSSATPQPGSQAVTRAITIADLTAEGKETFKYDFMIYQEMKKDYAKEAEALRAVREWITKTVNTDYRQTCCQSQKTIKEWFEALQEQVGMSTYATESLIIDNYHKAIKPLTKPPKDFQQWITEWEKALAKVQEYDLAVGKHPREWFRDFVNAVQQIMPHWVDSFRRSMKKEIENASLSYRTLANDFRDSTQPLTNTKAKVAKGSFGPMFGRKSAPAAGKPSSATGDALDDGMEARGLNDGRNGMKQEGSGKQGVYANKQLKRRGRPGENSTSSSRKTVCRGCGQFHNTQTCFYLFPERAPEWFSGNEQVRKAVEQNLRENTSLAEEVNRMKKRRQTNTTTTNEDPESSQD